MYYKVPIIDGVMDIDYDFLISAYTVSPIEAVVMLKEGFEVRESWQEISKDEFLAVKASYKTS